MGSLEQMSMFLKRLSFDTAQSVEDMTRGRTEAEEATGSRTHWTARLPVNLPASSSFNEEKRKALYKGDDLNVRVQSVHIP